jgi:N-formylglutamate deformylase
MVPAPFKVHEPTSAETPVVVEVPHAGLYVPPEHTQGLLAPVRAIARDADLYVDELYADAPAQGATLLVANVSRYIVDLNRSDREFDADAVQGGARDARMPRGLIWRLTTDGERAIGAPIARAELEARLDAIYRPYHRTLSEIVARKLARFGIAVVLPGHSMPSVGRTTHGGPLNTRADVVPGTRGRTSAGPAFIDLVDAHARAQGWTVVHDDPYKGGFVTQHHGRPSERVHCVQVELARRLYMDEATLRRNDSSLLHVRQWCSALVAELGRTALR